MLSETTARPRICKHKRTHFMAYSIEQICTMALNRLKATGSVLDVQNPTTQAEKVFNTWYWNVKNRVLRYSDYRDAITRATITNDPDAPEDFTYTKKWKLPEDCVKFLGVGNLQQYDQYGYVLESGWLCLRYGYKVVQDPDSDKEVYDLNIRYIRDIAEADMSDDFALLLAAELAAEPGIATPLADSDARIQRCQAEAEVAKKTFMSANKQENRPIIIRRSGRFGRRYTDPHKAL